MAPTKTRRGNSEPKLNDQGLAVFRYDKNPDGTNARFIHARPGTPWFDVLNESAGWYQVDPKEKADDDAAKAAAEGKQEEFADQQRRQNTRLGQLSSLEGYSRGRGRPSNAEKAALARADEAARQLAERDREIEALRQQLAERDAAVEDADLTDAEGDENEDENA